MINFDDVWRPVGHVTVGPVTVTVVGEKQKQNYIIGFTSSSKDNKHVDV